MMTFVWSQVFFNMFERRRVKIKRVRLPAGRLLGNAQKITQLSSSCQLGEDEGEGEHSIYSYGNSSWVIREQKAY
jgi:hypothetical protein